MRLGWFLKDTYNCSAGVREVVYQVVVVDDSVASVDHRVKGVDERVANVDKRVKAVDEKVTEVFDDGKEVKVATQRLANDMDQMKRNQLRENLRKLLSPPDPSTNYNIACGTHRKGTATWFFQKVAFSPTGRKPGVRCFGFMENLAQARPFSVPRSSEKLRPCEAGHASVAYFYFDFRDAHKKQWRDLLLSLPTQLSSPSGPRCDLLSHLYSTHDNGAGQPSDDVLTHFLKEMLTLPDQHPTYLIMDVIDECSDSSGIPSPRERVLDLVKSLVGFRLPNLHLCVTSRPEIDIRNVLEHLTSCRVSLHDQTGKKKDIMDYVRSLFTRIRSQS